MLGIRKNEQNLPIPSTKIHIFYLEPFRLRLNAKMFRKASCNSTEYTKGFRITHTSDGFFIAVKGRNTLKAKSAQEIKEMIEKFEEEKIENP